MFLPLRKYHGRYIIISHCGSTMGGTQTSPTVEVPQKVHKPPTVEVPWEVHEHLPLWEYGDNPTISSPMKIPKLVFLNNK